MSAYIDEKLPDYDKIWTLNQVVTMIKILWPNFE